jgi:hypothetical protein
MRPEYRRGAIAEIVAFLGALTGEIDAELIAKPELA